MSIYKSHTNECINIILSLKNTLPLELIQFIIQLYWNLRSEPVLILHISYTSKEKDILSKFLKIHPGLRFYQIRYDLYSELFIDNLVIPRSIYRYKTMFNLMLLIPGPSWDIAACQPNSDIELVNGVQIFNGIWRNKHLNATIKYTRNIDGYVTWFTDSLNSPNFIAAQNKLL